MSDRMLQPKKTAIIIGEMFASHIIPGLGYSCHMFWNGLQLVSSAAILPKKVTTSSPTLAQVLALAPGISPYLCRMSA